VWHVREILATNLWGRVARSIILRCATRIIAVSEAAARPFRSWHVPVHVIHNAVDLTRFDPGLDRVAARRHLGLNPEAPIVGYVGQLNRDKGINELIAAVPLIRRHFPKTEFAIVGGSKHAAPVSRSWKHRLRRSLGFGEPVDQWQRVRAEIAHRGLEGSVHLLGALEDVPGALAAMDVVALPSWSEAFGRTVVEAMAMARPVVSVDVGGIHEIIRSPETGLLIPPPPHPEKLAEAIGMLLKDESLRAVIGRAARASVVDRFTPRMHLDAVEAVYRALGAADVTAPE